MRRLLIGLLAVGLVASSASAQRPVRLDIDHSKAWKHDRTGVVLPAAIDGIPRKSITEFEAGGWDVAAQYDIDNYAAVVSIYLYQAAVQDPSLLIAESRIPLETRKDVYGEVKPFTDVVPFAPPGDPVASGLRIAYETGGQFKSTALAIAPLGEDWIVKFRVSSRTMSPPQLNALVDRAIAALNWPTKASPHQAAVAMTACTTPTPELKKAKIVKQDGAMALFGALVGGAIAADDNQPVTRVTYCRDLGASRQFGLYRAENDPQRYLLSLGDSGRAIFVGRDELSETVSGEMKGKKKSGAIYAVRLVVPGSTTQYPSVDRLPPPDQALQIVSGPSLSRTSRSKGDRRIQIDSNSLK